MRLFGCASDTSDDPSDKAAPGVEKPVRTKRLERAGKYRTKVEVTVSIEMDVVDGSDERAPVSHNSRNGGRCRGKRFLAD